jgi:hypothetical protein
MKEKERTPAYAASVSVSSRRRRYRQLLRILVVFYCEQISIYNLGIQDCRGNYLAVWLNVVDHLT